MNASPSNPIIGATAYSPLYRIARHAVICAGLALILAQLLFAQSSSRAKKLTGPRALGLIEVSPSGKMTLLPVTIMIDGEFYDASAYKAAPVPFALYTDTVYEGVKTGVSQGLFTITTAQHGESVWRGQGKWQSADSIAAAEAKKKASAAAAERTKKIQDNSDGPPVLKRPGAPEQSPSPAASTPATSTHPTTSDTSQDDPSAPPVLKRPKTVQTKTDQTPSATTGPTATPAASTPTPATSTPTIPAPATVTQAGTPTTAAPAPAPQTAPPANDPNLPTLRRGKAAAAKEEAREAASTPGESAQTAVSKPPVVTMTATATANGIQYIPAISDASGPDPRPYAYGMKAEEEAKFRDKMLALAAVEIRARAKDLGLGNVAATVTPPRAATPASSTKAGAHPGRVAKSAGPTFDDVQLRVLDLSNNNEPVLVMTANARLPQTKGPGAAPDMQYLVTLVAREDIYGDLHKAFSNVTDNQHLDVLPRMEFIDAVDADGDGRGELLFRQVSDSGKAFVLYRVIGDQLWPLFQGKLG
jgi:hypothetical protein